MEFFFEINIKIFNSLAPSLTDMMLVVTLIKVAVADLDYSTFSTQIMST